MAIKKEGKNQKVNQPSLKDFLLNVTPEEKQKIIRELENDLSEERIQESLKGMKTIKIDDFYSPRVKPFACGKNHIVEGVKHFAHEGKAVYSVFVKSNSQITPQNGMEILTYFGKNSGKKKNFMEKTLGDRIVIDYHDDNFVVRFKHYELTVPDRDVEVIAKELKKDPKEIILSSKVERLYSENEMDSM